MAYCNLYCSGNPGKCTLPCETNPEQFPYGIYRVLNTGKTEFTSYCSFIAQADGTSDNAVKNYTSINTQKLGAFLDQLFGSQQ